MKKGVQANTAFLKNLAEKVHFMIDRSYFFRENIVSPAMSY
jgi:hypothetical protein